MSKDASRHLEEMEKAWTVDARESVDRYTAVHLGVLDEGTYQSLLKEILYYVDLPKQSAILDVGCGNGLLTEQFLKRRYRNIVGCDLSTGMIEQARKQMPEVRFFCTDAANLSMFPPESFDLVCAHSVFHMFPDDEYAKRAICELFRVTKREGSIMILDVLGSYWRQWHESLSYGSFWKQLSANIGYWKQWYDKYGLKEALSKSETLFKNFVRKMMRRHYSVRRPFKEHYIAPDLFFEALNGENCKIYPLVEVLNTKPLIYKQFRYNVLIRKPR
jgi:ubiquinone/menaquinone biosynthesis C-methylase UbiE